MSDPNEEPAPNNYSPHYTHHHQAQMDHHHDHDQHQLQDQHLHQDQHHHQDQHLNQDQQLHQDQHHQDQQLHQDHQDQHHQASGEYSHYPPLYDYSHNTAAHAQGNHANMPAYDYFHPTPYNEVDQQQHNVEQHRGHAVHQLQYPSHQHTQIHAGPYHPHQHHPQAQHHYPQNSHQMHMQTQQPQAIVPEKKKVSANEAWEIKYQLLLQFRAVHNHVDVPQTYKENKSLGKWVGKQREQYKVFCQNLQAPPDERISCAMTEERARKLSEVGFKWSMGKGQYGKIHGIFDGSGNMTRLWEQKFAQLEMFKHIYGHVNLPHITSTGNFEAPVPSHPDIGEGNEQMLSEEEIRGLSRWVKHQQQKYQDVEEGKVAAGQALELRFHRLMGLGLEFRTESSLEGGRNASSRDMTKVKEYRNHLWEARYTELCHYVQTYGHANVPATDKENQQLARWVGVQRDCYRTRKRQIEELQPVTNIHLAKNAPVKPAAPSRPNPLTGERIEQLRRIGFEFSVHANRWEEKLKELIAYKKKRGHMRVRHSENKQLYEWIARQRNVFREYMQGTATAGQTMNSERIGHLENIGFNWHYNFESVTAKALKTALEKAENGNVKKKKSKILKHDTEQTENEEVVNNKVNECASEDVSDGIHDPSAAAPSQNSNIDNVQVDNQEHQNGSNLVGNDESCFNQPIPITAVLEPYSLHESQSVPANTMNYIAPMHKKGTKPQLWQQSYDKLVSFQQINSHCKVPGRYPPDPKLGTWVKLQREDFKHFQEGKPSPMNDYRIGLLEKIGFEWTILTVNDRRNAWNVRYGQIKEFKKQYGHCNVPQQYATNKSLGKWVSKQREAYRSFIQWKPSSITKEKIKLLEDIGFQFKVGRGKATRTWHAYFEDLISFQKQYGHTNIPLCYAPDPSLGKWVYQQRCNMEKRLSGKATNGTIKKRLETLQKTGFSFHVKEPDTGRKRRSDFGSSRQSKNKQNNCTEEGEVECEENHRTEEHDRESIRLQEREQNLDPVPIDEHNPDEIREMDCLENVCEAFAL